MTRPFQPALFFPARPACNIFDVPLDFGHGHECANID
ncbi:hypothetical protein [Inoviridae sp.]|nr:hypothetical protein [Inoviridae sp.]